MAIEFFQTVMGQKFYGVDVPSITKSLELIAKHMGVLAQRIEREEEARQRYEKERQHEMEKFGVDEGKNDEQQEKQAAGGCPKCGAKVERHGSTLVCPNCGTEPFEKQERQP